MKKYLTAKCRIRLILFILGFQIPLKGICQVKIKGPDCVISGNTYSYQFIGDSINIANISKVCLVGGIIYSTNNTCLTTEADSSKKYIYYTYVRWNDSTTTGSITASASSASITLNVIITSQLDEGKLDTATRVQHIPYNSVPASIICSDASGGNCSPSYSYWWEQSTDNLKWTKMPNAKEQNLTINWKFTKTIYFRRRVTDKKGNSTAMSASAIVFVEPDIAGH